MILLPLPPSDNDRLISRKGSNRLILSSGARSYLDVAKAIIRHQMNAPRIETSFEHQVQILYLVYLRDKRRDAGDMLKIIADACSKIVYDDDKWVRWTLMPIEIDRQNPRIQVYGAGRSTREDWPFIRGLWLVNGGPEYFLRGYSSKPKERRVA